MINRTRSQVWLYDEQCEELRGNPLDRTRVDKRLRLLGLESTGFNEPLPLAGQEAVAFRHVSVACLEGGFGGQSR